ncbi:STAS domain-containing protein [Actinokineospora sp. NBRC 105648]|uniref:STAS domain-containing protein n=1 Tax=Actinokineospora sp. NBRC 105648 TaxID=3032206 RepID=UPI0024A0C440|nr:STAS domain-containing protein [Actinokineospora sp. NBRC 105648]GLZ38863.1 hypothetical protein Acsp05_24870 [Actinokineospora sp. NBRC 105648]
MSPLLTFTRTASVGHTVLAVSGEVDMSSAHLFDRALADAVGERAGPVVVVDLGAVRFLSAVGVDVLVNAHCRARDAGLELLVVAPEGSPAHRTVTLAGLGALVDLRPSIHAALSQDT